MILVWLSIYIGRQISIAETGDKKARDFELSENSDKAGPTLNVIRIRRYQHMHFCHFQQGYQSSISLRKRDNLFQWVEQSVFRVGSRILVSGTTPAKTAIQPF